MFLIITVDDFLQECGCLKIDIDSLNKELKNLIIEQNENTYLILKTTKNR